MNVTNFTISEYDWNKMEAEIIDDATKNESGGKTWFKNKEEFDEWAGDMFWEFLTVALESLGGELE